MADREMEGLYPREELLEAKSWWRHTPSPERRFPIGGKGMNPSQRRQGLNSSQSDLASSAKEELQSFIQRRFKAYSALKYDSTEVEGGWQCTLVVTCDEGATFVGEVAQNKRQSEINAAQQAVHSYGLKVAPEAPGEVVWRSSEAPRAKKPKMSSTLFAPFSDTGLDPSFSSNVGGSKAASFTPLAPTSQFRRPTPKASPRSFNSTTSFAHSDFVSDQGLAECKKNWLRGVVMTIVQACADDHPRPEEGILVGKNDIVYQRSQIETETGEEGYQTTVRIKGLPGYEGVDFIGGFSDNPNDADQYAAGEALIVIEADPFLQQIIAASEAKKSVKIQQKEMYEEREMQQQGQCNSNHIGVMPAVPKSTKEGGLGMDIQAWARLGMGL